MSRDEHLTRAYGAFEQLLANVGTACFPNRENPAEIDKWSTVLEIELTAARAAAARTPGHLGNGATRPEPD